MALIQCRECGREISDKAKTCPGCGYPVGLDPANDTHIAPKPKSAPPPPAATPAPKPDTPETELIKVRKSLINDLGNLGLVAFIIVTVLALIILAAAGVLSMTFPIAGIAIAVILLIGLPGLTWRWLQCYRSRLTITSRRAIFAFGIWSVTTTEIMLRDIREVQVRRTLIQRLLGTGDLMISSAASGSAEIDIRGIKSPNDVARIINDARD